MSTTRVKIPTSRLHLGHARHDITPPVGIYHRMWGAARHDAATGVHRPLQIDIFVLEPLGGDATQRLVRIQIDFVLLSNDQQDRLIAPVAAAADVDPARVIITHSHSHAAGFYEPDRHELPGGELIDSYLEDLHAQSAATASAAVANRADATITYASGRCDMAANRDYWDDANAIFTTGYNPDQPVANTIVVGRVSDPTGATRLILVNYACHPTTLAWDNTLLSPDFVGALRETVERDQYAPCCYFQAPCGDLGPTDGFVGDTAVADRNGRQVGHAALSVLYGMGVPGADFAYAGPVVSGATIGTWAWQPHDDARDAATAAFAGDVFTIDLDLIDLPTAENLQVQLERFTAARADADARDDMVAARDAGARAERCRRWLARIANLPDGSTFALDYSVYHFGDAVWITTSAEPYSWLGDELRRRFPGLTLLITPISGNTQVAYLLTRDHYGKGLYQEEPSSLAPGCLEALADAISSRIADITNQQAEA